MLTFVLFPFSTTPFTHICWVHIVSPDGVALITWFARVFVCCVIIFSPVCGEFDDFSCWLVVCVVCFLAGGCLRLRVRRLVIPIWLREIDILCAKVFLGPEEEQSPNPPPFRPPAQYVSSFAPPRNRTRKHVSGAPRGAARRRRPSKEVEGVIGIGMERRRINSCCVVF